MIVTDRIIARYFTCSMSFFCIASVIYFKKITIYVATSHSINPQQRLRKKLILDDVMGSRNLLIICRVVMTQAKMKTKTNYICLRTFHENVTRLPWYLSYIFPLGLLSPPLLLIRSSAFFFAAIFSVGVRLSLSLTAFFLFATCFSYHSVSIFLSLKRKQSGIHL